MYSHALIAGFIGLFWGSFLYVVCVRFGKWKSIAVSRSHCPHCHHTLEWYDLIPILSFIMLSGRCRYCHTSISPYYPFVEIVTGLSTFLLWLALSPHGIREYLFTILVVLFAYAVLLMALQDHASMNVSDELFIAAAIIALLALFVTPHTLSDTILGLLVAAPFLIMVSLSHETWMGWGDVFIAAPAGLVLGFPLAWVWLYVAFIVGALWGIVLILSGKKKRRDPVAFVPILYVSFIITVVWGDVLINWYVRATL